MRPKDVKLRSTTSRTPAASVTSSISRWNVSGYFRMRSATLSWRRTVPTTVSPRSRSWVASSRPKPLLTPVMSQVCAAMSLSFVTGGRGLVDGGERVERAGEADERQQGGDDADQRLPVVSDIEVGRDVPCDLGVASAESGQHREGEQLAGRQVDPGAGVVVAEAVGGQEPLDVELVLRRRGVHALGPVRPGDLLAHCPALLRPGGGRSRGLSGQR